MFFFLSVNG